MNVRKARKVIARWARGEGSYSWNKYGTVIRAHHKLESYYRRRGVDIGREGPIQMRGLSYRGLPGLPYGG